MAVDVLLVLAEDLVVTADQDTDPIDVEGGGLNWVRGQWGAMSGGSTTCDIIVLVSPDAGVTYYMKGKFQQVGPTDDDKLDRIPVYIPQPETPGTPCKVKLRIDVAGSSPSYELAFFALEPMTSLAPPSSDEYQEVGAASQISAV